MKISEWLPRLLVWSVRLSVVSCCFVASAANTPSKSSATFEELREKAISQIGANGNSKPPTLKSTSTQPKLDGANKTQAPDSKIIVWNWDRPYTPSKDVIELQKLADAGDQRAEAEMSLRYLFAEGILIDPKKALSLCESNPHPIAQYALALILRRKDEKRADEILCQILDPLRSLSDQGDSLATALVGDYSEEGFAGISVDKLEAEKFYNKSHAAGCNIGTRQLGALLWSERQGAEFQKGRRLLRQASSRGSAPALSLLLFDAHDEMDKWKKGEPTNESVTDLNLFYTLSRDVGTLGKLYWLSRGFPESHRNDTRAFKILETLKSEHSLEIFDSQLDSKFAWHYMNGLGTSKNYQLGFKFALKSALQGVTNSYDILRIAYVNGHGIPKSYIHAYAWALLTSAKGIYKDPEAILTPFEKFLSPLQISEAQKLAESLNTEIENNRKQGTLKNDSKDRRDNNNLASSGTGFFISENGYIATNFHVVSGATKISVRTASGEMGAVVVLADQLNDVAVLKAPVFGKPLKIGDVSAVKTGRPVYTVGFPNPFVQGFEPKLTKGDINCATGMKDDPRMFQISVPIQPGNSGGPLLDENGAVLGIITSKLSDLAALSISGSLPQAVNYALKIIYLKPLIESNKELKEAVDLANKKKSDTVPPESVMESVLLISVKK